MSKPKQLDYAAMFSYDAKNGLYYTTRTIDGKRRWFRSKDAAELHRRVEAALSGAGQPVTFRAVAERWQESKWPTIEQNTQVCYNSAYKRAVDEFGDKPIADIIPAELERLIQRMKAQGYAAKTVRTQKTVLKMIFDFAITMESPPILHNPVASVAVPRGLPRKKRSAPDDDVMQIVIDSVDTAYFGLYPFFLLYTGCRRGEALAVTWGDVDRAKKQITINKEYVFPAGMPVLKDTKTEAGERTVPLLPGLDAHLRRPKGAKDTDLIFSVQGRPLTENAYRRRWRHYCKDVGLYTDNPVERISSQGKRYVWHDIKPTLTAHQLRHGYATILFESRVDVKTAQSLMGHADVHTTMQIYTDLRQRHRLEQVEQIGAYLDKTYGDCSGKM